MVTSIASQCCRILFLMGRLHLPQRKVEALVSCTPETNTTVTAAGRWAGNSWLNFVRPGSNPVRARAGFLRQPDLLR